MNNIENIENIEKRNKKSDIKWNDIISKQIY